MDEIETDSYLDGLEDFDLETAVFEVWALGYTSEGEPTDFEIYYSSFKEIEAAREYAAELSNTLLKDGFEKVDDDTVVITVEVETVVEVDEDCLENVNTVFIRKVWERN